MKPTPWHALSTDEVLATTGSSPQGLTTAEAQARLLETGANTLPQAAGDSILTMIGRQMASPLVLVLLGSAALAFLMGKPADAGVVLVVVVLNTLIGFVQEYKAGRAIEGLADLVPDLATGIRGGQRRTLPAADLVPGDVVWLQSGDRVPADLRLLEVKTLQVVEAALTGESLPVEKHTDPVPAKAALGDRLDMAFSGTLVSHGTALGVVVATATRTELGHISELMRGTGQVETPLMREMNRLGKQLSWMILGITALVFGAGLLRGWTVADGASAALSLAVAAIPEGLPAVISIALAIGVRRMAARRAVIRRLPAVETLGATTIICSDKTGTLTRNEMSVRTAWIAGAEFHFEGIGYAPEGTIKQEGVALGVLPDTLADLLRAAVLCNDTSVSVEAGRWVLHGDPTEGALVAAAARGGLLAEPVRSGFARLDTLPFESEHKYMATLHAWGSQRRLLMKGAPEVVLLRCSQDNAGQPLDQAELLAEAARLASQGLRVLALAARPTEQTILCAEELEGGFIFLGLLGMIDPPRAESILAIGQCKRAGIEVKMITGDHPGTAQAIGRELGLEASRPAVTGQDLDALDPVAFAEMARTAHVFARVSPEHKLRLVTALQEGGAVVAMTGDGVNDAPALKRADIGVAMGITGTAVSREAADMVLLDDDFASIRAAVEEGRRVYDNLIKALAFALPANLGQGLVMLVAVLCFPFREGHPLLPILPVQILWINLVVAVTLALPLAFEAPEPEIMARPPRRPGTALMGAFLVGRTVLVAVLMAAAAVGLFLYEYTTTEVLDPNLALRKAQTLAVTGLVLIQACYLLNCRSLTEGFWKMGLFSNPSIFAGLALLLGLQVAMVHVPLFQRLFHTAPLAPRDWLLAAAVGFVVLPVIALEKAWRRRRAS